MECYQNRHLNHFSKCVALLNKDKWNCDKAIVRTGTLLTAVTSNQMSKIILSAWGFQLDVLSGTTGASSDRPMWKITFLLLRLHLLQGSGFLCLLVCRPRRWSSSAKLSIWWRTSEQSNQLLVGGAFGRDMNQKISKLRCSKESSSTRHSPHLPGKKWNQNQNIDLGSWNDFVRGQFFLLICNMLMDSPFTLFRQWKQFPRLIFIAQSSFGKCRIHSLSLQLFPWCRLRLEPGLGSLGFIHGHPLPAKAEN